MSEDLALLIWLTESEYNGGSFNSPNLVKTLDALTLEQVTSTDTTEGYTVWGMVLHLAYWKLQLAKELGAAELPDFPYEGKDFPALPDLPDLAAWQSEDNLPLGGEGARDALPDSPGLAAWQQTLATLDAAHAAYMAALRAFPAEKLSDAMSWGCTYGQIIAWMATHDTYHTAMIRNMGVPGLADVAAP